MTAFGTYQKPVMAAGDKFAARENVDKPLIVIPKERKEGMKTKHKPAGDGVGVIVDVVDLYANNGAGAVFIDVLWMGGAVVDGFSQYLGTGQPFPVKLQWTAPTGGGQNFISAAPLEGAELQFAEQWWAAYPTRVDAERAERQQRAVTMAQAQGQVPAVAAPPLPALGVPTAPPVPAAAPAAPPAPPQQFQQAPPAPPVPQAPPAPPQQFQQAPPAPPQAPQVPQPQYAMPAAPQAPQQPQYQAPAYAPPAAPVAPAAAPQMPQAPQYQAAPPQAAPMAPPVPPGQVTDQSVDQIMANLNAPMMPQG